MNMRASLAFFVAATAATQIGAGAATSTASVDVRVQRGRPLGTFDRAFASVTYDIQNFIGFDIAPWSFNWSSPQLRNLLAPMSPMTVRCGGTWEDGIFWEGGPKTGRNPRTKPAMAAHTLTASAWDPFAQTMSSMAGVDLVVGLGALWRDWEGCDDVGADGVCPGAIPWDSANARAFIQHNREAGHTIWGYELGNEPGVWNWTWGVPIVTPQQHAADYAALQAVLAKEYSSGSTTRPKVVGPDTTWGPVGDEKPDGTGRNPVPGKGGPCYDYWNATLQRAPALDVAAFHYYAVQPGVVRSWRDFASIARNGSMCTAVAAHAKDLASSPLAGKVPLWLGEGGATYGGFPNAHVMGKNWLRLFGGGLSYLEDLGCAASNGARVFARQQLSNFLSGNRTAGSSHAAWDYTPQPAWWVAVLWKRLVGTTAFGTTVGDPASAVHAYAFDGGAGAGAATVVALVNWDEDWNATTGVVVHGCTQPSDVYVLSPAGPIHDGDGGGRGVVPDSAGLAVNGKEARVAADGTIPAGTLDPRVAPCDAGAVRVDLAGLTMAFVVLK